MVKVLGFWALRFGFRRSHSDYPGEACGSGLRVSGLGARGFRIYCFGLSDLLCQVSFRANFKVASFIGLLLCEGCQKSFRSQKGSFSMKAGSAKASWQPLTWVFVRVYVRLCFCMVSGGFLTHGFIRVLWGFGVLECVGFRLHLRLVLENLSGLVRGSCFLHGLLSLLSVSFHQASGKQCGAFHSGSCKASCRAS